MTAYDVFNGDADGFCALQQLRLARPLASIRVTGVKRDIQLLRRVVPEPGDAVTVLDISLDSNREDLARILDAGAEVEYFDHHFSGDVPEHPRLRARLSRSPDVCTSLLVDEFLGGEHRSWALVGAFGDNLDAVALRLAGDRFSESELATLSELGRLLNYNSYGRTVEDLHVPPDELFERLHPYRDPLEFATREAVFRKMRDGFATDMAHAAGLKPEVSEERLSVFVLPNEAWSRRILGPMANELMRRHPGMAVAVLVPNTASCYMVSLRVSGDSPRRADEFCRGFATGGGRATAGGINHLPRERLVEFVQRLREFAGEREDAGPDGTTTTSPAPAGGPVSRRESSGGAARGNSETGAACAGPGRGASPRRRGPLCCARLR